MLDYGTLFRLFRVIDKHLSFHKNVDSYPGYRHFAQWLFNQVLLVAGTLDIVSFAFSGKRFEDMQVALTVFKSFPVYRRTPE